MAEKSTLYILRPEFMGKLMKFKVHVDQQYIGFTRGQNFLKVLLDPGIHAITSKAGRFGNLFDMNIEIFPGKDLYIVQDLRTGWWTSNNELRIVNEEVGEKYLIQCKPGKQEIDEI